MMGASGEPSGYYPMDSSGVMVQSELPAPCACLTPLQTLVCSAAWNDLCSGSEPCNHRSQLLLFGLCNLQFPIPPIPIRPCSVDGGSGNKDRCAAICLGGAYCVSTRHGVVCFCDDRGGGCSAQCASGSSCSAVCPPGLMPICGCADGVAGCGCVSAHTNSTTANL